MDVLANGQVMNAGNQLLAPMRLQGEIYIHVEVISFWMMGMARTRPSLREDTPAYTLSPSKLWRATQDMRII